MCLWFHSLHLAATTTETRKKLQINWYWQPKKEARMWSIFDRVRNGDRNIFAHGISSQLQFEAFFRQDMRYRKFHFLDRHFVSGVPLCLCLYCIYIGFIWQHTTRNLLNIHIISSNAFGAIQRKSIFIESHFCHTTARFNRRLSRYMVIPNISNGIARVLNINQINGITNVRKIIDNMML